ncbi:MAG: PilZ domain-containing protein [bacterium]|nr:PilZ domain-containing protein [bacterium]
MEKRKFIRIDSQFIVWYQTIDEDELSFGRPQSKNISAGGILLELDESLKAGTCISLKFKLPNMDREVLAQGRVVRQQRLGSGKIDTGIEFTTISGEDEDLIAKLGS